MGEVRMDLQPIVDIINNPILFLAIIIGWLLLKDLLFPPPRPRRKPRYPPMLDPRLWGMDDENGEKKR